MALQWSITDIHRYKTVCQKSDKTWAWTNSFIWSSLAIKLDSITKKNWKEWAARYLLLFPPPPHLTPAKARAYKKLVVRKVYQHIGLTTSVTKMHQKPKGAWYDTYIEREVNNTKAFNYIVHAENQVKAEKKRQCDQARRNKSGS